MVCKFNVHSFWMPIYSNSFLLLGTIIKWIQNIKAGSMYSTSKKVFLQLLVCCIEDLWRLNDQVGHSNQFGIIWKLQRSPIWMSHWRYTMVDGTEFVISCKQPAFLSSFSDSKFSAIYHRVASMWHPNRRPLKLPNDSKLISYTNNWERTFWKHGTYNQL